MIKILIAVWMLTLVITLISAFIKDEDLQYNVFDLGRLLFIIALVDTVIVLIILFLQGGTTL